MAYKLIGQNYQTPDLIAKVTGRSKYAEDYPRRRHAVHQAAAEPDAARAGAAYRCQRGAEDAWSARHPDGG